MVDRLPHHSQPPAEPWPDSPWTLPQLRLRLEEAAHTLRRLPLPKHGRPATAVTAWPDVVYDWLAYGWLPARAHGIRPTPYEIDRMDQVLPLLHLCTRDQRLVLWARANHFSWRKLEALDELERNGKGRTERALRNIMNDAEARILAYVNGTERRMVLQHAPDDYRHAGANAPAFTPHTRSR